MVATCKLSLSFVQSFIIRSFFLFYYYCMTTFVIKVPVRGRVPYQPIAASRNSFESPSCVEYSAAIFATVFAV